MLTWSEAIDQSSPAHPGGIRVVQCSSTMLLIESQRDTTRARCGFGGAFKPDDGRKDVPLLLVSAADPLYVSCSSSTHRSTNKENRPHGDSVSHCVSLLTFSCLVFSFWGFSGHAITCHFTVINTSMWSIEFRWCNTLRFVTFHPRGIHACRRFLRLFLRLHKLRTPPSMLWQRLHASASTTRKKHG